MEDLDVVLYLGVPRSEDKKNITEGLLAHHASFGHTRNPKEFISVFLKDGAGNVLGGVIASYLWNVMQIESLWVHESLRGQKWGKRLISEVEKRAKVRDCTIMIVNTFDYQAPEFYKKLGFTEYGKLEDFPPGRSLYYFQKKIK